MNGYVLLDIYCTYILPILEYGNLCLMYTKTQSFKLESVQRKITKYICYKFGLFDLNYNERLDFLKTDRLSVRRFRQLHKFSLN